MPLWQRSQGTAEVSTVSGGCVAPGCKSPRQSTRTRETWLLKKAQHTKGSKTPPGNQRPRSEVAALGDQVCWGHAQATVSASLPQTQNKPEIRSSQQRGIGKGAGQGANKALPHTRTQREGRRHPASR